MGAWKEVREESQGRNDKQQKVARASHWALELGSCADSTAQKDLWAHTGWDPLVEWKLELAAFLVSLPLAWDTTELILVLCETYHKDS